MANDDDILEGLVPAPDAEPTAEERAGAKSFAGLVDKALAGRTPAAMSADTRALVEVATMIRATTGHAELGRDKQRSIIEDALRQAVGSRVTTAAPTPSGVTPITAARSRRWLPWTIAGASSLVAAAAIALLVVRQPAPVTVEVPVAVEAAEVPMTWRSRPADALVGPIDRAASGHAVTRIDSIFENRLHGYRDRRLAGVTRPARGGK